MNKLIFDNVEVSKKEFYESTFRNSDLSDKGVL